MKRFLLFILLCMSIINAQTWEKLSPYPGANQVIDIYFYNSDLGFVGAANGSILRTSDGGATWTEIYCGHLDGVHSVYFTNETTGYACGYHKMILKTTDGGLTWSDLAYSADVFKGYESIVFSDANTGWVAGDEGVVLKTTNAGVTWTAVTSPFSGTIQKLLYLGSNKLIAVGNVSNNWKSTDGGVTWTAKSNGLGVSRWGLDASTSDNNTIFVAATSGWITKSTDAGETWTASQTGVTTEHLYSVFFTSSLIGYIGNGAVSIFKTTDGGATWSTSSSGTTSMMAISFIDANNGFAGGGSGTMLKTTNGGSTWTTINRGVAFSILTGWFTDTNTGYIANGDWTAGIYKTTNGGSDWTLNTSSIAQGGVFDLMFVGTNNGYGCGYNADYSALLLIKTTNAGGSWSEVDITSTGITYINSISLFFPTTSIGYIVGDNSDASASILAKTTDSGDTWTVIKNDLSPVYACYFVDATTGYVAGMNGFAAKTIDSGEHWTTLTTNTSETLRSVSFNSLSIGFICGTNGKIIKTTDGGNTWADKSISTTKTLNKIKCLYENDILTCGSSGALYLSNNGGTNWTAQSVTTNNDLYTISIIGSTGWVFGSQGNIYKSNSPLPVELTSFTASTSDNKVTLNWQTATEVNNYGFEVERSTNLQGLTNGKEGSNLGGFTSIGFVEGSGNSNSTKEYSFTDNKVTAGNYYYRLKQIDTDGSFAYSKEIVIETGHAPSLPAEFALYQNYPNPFNPVTTIRYALPTVKMGYIPSLQHVTLKIYDILGNEVVTLVNENKEPGNYEVIFDGSKFASGVYIYRINVNNNIKTDAFVQVMKMVLIK
ncbi:MAG: YCF48-related protein [bacterium]